MAADGSGWKQTDLGRQRCEGSRDGRRTRSTASSRQEPSRREDKGADTRGRHEEGGWAATSASDAVEGQWGVRVHQTQEMKSKEGTGDPGGPDAKSGRYSSGSGLCPSGEKGFFADDARDLLYFRRQIGHFLGMVGRCSVDRAAPSPCRFDGKAIIYQVLTTARVDPM